MVLLYTDDIRLRPLDLVTDMLHAWPEYYDEEKEIWTPVDPHLGKNNSGGLITTIKVT